MFQNPSLPFVLPQFITIIVMSSNDGNISRPTSPPGSLQAPISPPRTKRSLTKSSLFDIEEAQTDEDGANRIREHSNRQAPSLAAIEAGEIRIQDHLSTFSSRLARVVRILSPGPRLAISDFEALYERNCHPHGSHFVVHQHDHPVAGVHYDLRLQISETSSISFAIMYGLPGNPNSKRLNRNATETRVHNLWVRFLFQPVNCHTKQP